MYVNSSTSKTKHFEEWAKGKSPFLASSCLAIASSADDCLEMFTEIKESTWLKDFTNIPPLHQWLNLYKDHRRLYRGATAALRSVNDEMCQMVDFYEMMIGAFHQIGKMTQEEFKQEWEKTPPEELKKGIENVRQAFDEFNQLIIKSDADNKSNNHETTDAEEQKKIRRFINTPEVRFYLQVWIPCVLIYGIYPPNMLMKARHDDDNAIEKLLRLDSSVINDPLIGEILHRAAVAKRQGKMSLVAQALKTQPKVKLDLQTIKYSLSGLISVISITLGQKLQAMEIHLLFDAIARDTGKGAIDEDLIVTPEAFEKAIQRARAFWQIPHLVDKK